MIPTEETVGQSTQWFGDYKFSLVPILAIEIARLGDDGYWENARKVLEFWIESENRNLTRIRAGLRSWEMPAKYETNTLPRSGRTAQWRSQPSEELLNNGILHLSECLECVGSQLNATGNFVAAVEAGLLYRYLHKKFAIFANDRNDMGKLTFLFNTLLGKLPPEKRGYVFAGIDEIQTRLETALTDAFEK